jgi:hypothetical protein
VRFFPIVDPSGAPDSCVKHAQAINVLNPSAAWEKLV